MTDLEDLFEQSRAAGPQPSVALMARVMADAEQVQKAKPAPVPVVRAGLFDRFAALFGGGGAIACGMMAGVAGLTLGYVQPEGLASLSDLLVDTSTSSLSVEFMPGYDSLALEEGL